MCILTCPVSIATPEIALFDSPRRYMVLRSITCCVVVVVVWIMLWSKNQDLGKNCRQMCTVTLNSEFLRRVPYKFAAKRLLLGSWYRTHTLLRRVRLGTRLTYITYGFTSLPRAGKQRFQRKNNSKCDISIIVSFRPHHNYVKHILCTFFILFYNKSRFWQFPDEDDIVCRNVGGYREKRYFCNFFSLCSQTPFCLRKIDSSNHSI